MGPAMKDKRWSLVVSVLLVGACGGGDTSMVAPDSGVAIDASVPDASSGTDSGVGPEAARDGAGVDIDGAVVACTPGAKQCAGNVAEVCVAGGNAWNRLSCANGCEMGVCMPLPLEAGWKVHQ